MGDGIPGIVSKLRIDHWDGSSWSLAAYEDPGGSSLLRAVSAQADNDAMAVGMHMTGMTELTLAMRWNGKRWYQVPSPNVANADNVLTGLAVHSAIDAWAVGSYADSTPGALTQTLTLHWDSSYWSRVPSPNVSGVNNILAGVAAVATNDVWAVGETGIGGERHPLILHWNGAAWQTVAGPDTHRPLYAVAALAPNDVWTVGEGVSKHWDGTAWSQVPVPFDLPYYALTISAAGELFAVTDGTVAGSDILLYWNGSFWTQEYLPFGGEVHPQGLTTAGTEGWLVGYRDLSDMTARQIVYHFNTAGCQTPTPTGSPTPTPTGPPSSATPTRTLPPYPTQPPRTPPPTDTPTITRTPNPIYCWSEWIGTWGGYSAAAVYGANDLWFVGHTSIPSADNCYGTLPLVTHGGNLTMPSYNCALYNRLSVVTAVGPNEAWALGRAGNADPLPAISLHCGATACTEVPIATVGTAQPYLDGISGISPTDVWAVGEYTPPGGFTQTLIEHSNGQTWTVVPSPNVPGFNNSLVSVVALASNDVWAVGRFYNITMHSLILHWDGVVWQIINSPDTREDLHTVSAASPSDVWAIGSTQVLHWNGSTWSLAPAPPFGGLYSLSARPNNVWVLGGNRQIAYWNGQEWWLVPVPFDDMSSVLVLGPLDIRVTGTISAWDKWLHTLVLDYNCTIPFPTPGGPTQTRTATPTFTPTPTITPTQTPHPGQFEDVPPSNPFYEYVECMGLHGIIGGYPCGSPGEPCYGPPKPYFRPNNNVTRAQVSKMIGLAAAWADPVPSTQQTFRDVPIGSTFWTYIERMASRNVVGGTLAAGRSSRAPASISARTTT